MEIKITLTNLDELDELAAKISALKSEVIPANAKETPAKTAEPKKARAEQKAPKAEPETVKAEPEVPKAEQIPAEASAPDPAPTPAPEEPKHTMVELRALCANLKQAKGVKTLKQLLKEFEADRVTAIPAERIDAAYERAVELNA